MSQAEYKTPSGKVIHLEQAGSDVEVSIDGEPMFGGAEFIEHAQHGTCLKSRFGNVVIKIPAASIAAIQVVYADARAYADQDGAAKAAYDSHHAKVLRRMEGN